MTRLKSSTVTEFPRGTLIRTPRGEVAIEELVGGDIVITRNGGASLRHVEGDQRNNVEMVDIAARTFSNTHDVSVLATTRICADERDPVAVSTLVNNKGITQKIVNNLPVYRLILDRDEIVFANGIPVCHPVLRAQSRAVTDIKGSVLDAMSDQRKSTGLPDSFAIL